ncbi:MAG: PAS domain S-box protein [Actinomycetota bacterium]|nr:PAS domain S-box protein [Actinomycetota bacterium]
MKTPLAESLLAAIVSSSDDAIYSKSTEAILTSWNDGAERLYGYTAEEAIGQPLAILIPEHRKGEERQILNRILRGERIDHFETERQHKDGSIIEVSVTVSPLRDPSGTVVGASTIARDVSERKEFEAAQARLSAIVSSSDDAIYSKSRDAILTSWNPAAERLYGYTAEEAIGRPVSIIIPPSRANEEQVILSQILEGEVIEHYESQRQRKDGTIVHVSISVSPMRSRSGEIVGASTIARDISSRKEVEEMKDRFIANAAHELRTPLSTLSALASALASEWENIEADKRQELLTAMVRQGGRAKILINNLLEISQIDAGTLRIVPEPVDVGELVRSSVEAAPAPEGKAVRVEVAHGLVAEADPVRLSQVVTNLLTNSYRYGGNSIEVRARPVGDIALVSVGDDGPGVPDDLIDEIFDPFTRGPEAGAKQGSGLGLAITRALIDGMGGSVSYRHNSPRGALFEIRLSRHA